MKFYDLYNHYIIEGANAFSIANYNLMQGSTPVALIVGRFNPWTRGHNALLEAAVQEGKIKNIIIVLIKGKKSSEDKEKNPFDENLQKEIINRTNNPYIKAIIIESSANLPQIINNVRKLGYEPKQLWTGTDRVADYTRQLKYAEAINAKMKIFELPRNEDDADVAGISATKVRQAIRNHDYVTTRNMMINIDPQLFEKMYQQIISR